MVIQVHATPDVTIGDPEIAAAIGRYTGLVERRTDAARRLGEEQNAVQDAVEADRQAAADAVRKGKALPSDKAVRAQLDKALAAERELDVIERALVDEGRALEETVAERRGAYAARLGEEIADARDEELQALEVYAAAHRRTVESARVAQWLERFPRGKGWKAMGGLGTVPGLTTPAGETHGFEAVVDALAATARPPQPADAPVQPLRSVA